ncbi:riboflavin synthase [Neomoorella mulderi]|uniref:Riboflavin synthase n=1 Tax=Moorella mulderi DSM 14980 TaxID=1122241 RepID=A0A151AXZ6_9FIRM|nr:riboflavin synthase [Moorella mulderi]KYH32516.1 riboflavin synthase [Moorella mulderi DSM 14980]
MFTGLIEEIGTIQRVEPRTQGARLTIAAAKVLAGTRCGDSIAVNGACLTVVELKAGALVAEVMAETLRVTTLGYLKAGDKVNLERALQLGERLGGHLVSGHVDGVGEIKTKRQAGIAWELVVAVPPGLERYIAPKGSLALDGTSLTVIAVDGNMVTVGIIPHTARHTILGTKGPGDKVNIEVDLLARYLERLLTGPQEEPNRRGLTVEFLAANGFI